jgi:O-antigen ligase
VLWAGASAVGVLWIGLLTTTGLDLLNPAWSAKVFGTAIAHPVAFSLFSMVYLHRQHRVRAWLLWAYLIAGLLTLFAEKARFIIGYTVVVLILLWLTHARLQRILPWILAVGFVVCTTLAVAATQNTEGLMNTAWSYATLDTGADLGELSGRTELWTELQNYVADKPWLGYGFGAFWNPGQLVHIRDVIRWSPVVAHNGFLDEVLATGLIGAALAVMFWVTGLWLSIQRARSGRDTDFAAVVVCWIVLFLLFNWGDSIMQLYFRFPFYAALAGLFAVVARPVGDTNVRMNFTAS